MFFRHPALGFAHVASGVAYTPSGPIPEIWDVATKTPGIDLDGTKLIASGNASATTGDVVRGLVGRNSGKIYWEQVITFDPGGTGFKYGVGFVDEDYPSAGNAILVFNDNQVYQSGVGPITGTPGPWATGRVVGMAANLDLSPKKLWFTLEIGGVWYGITSDASPSPITNSGGISLAGFTGLLYPFVDTRIPNVVQTGRFIPPYSCPLAAGAISAGFGNWV